MPALDRVIQRERQTGGQMEPDTFLAPDFDPFKHNVSPIVTAPATRHWARRLPDGQPDDQQRETGGGLRRVDDATYEVRAGGWAVGDILIDGSERRKVVGLADVGRGFQLILAREIG